MNQDQEKMYEMFRIFEQRRLIQAKETGKPYHVNEHNQVIFENSKNTTTNK